MSEYTQEELAEFIGLVIGVNSHDGRRRVIARLDMNKFVSEHGKDKCDRMYEAVDWSKHCL